MGSREKMAAFRDRTAALQNSANMDSKSFSRVKSLFDPDSFVGLDNLVVSRPFSPMFDRPSVEGDGVEVGYGTVDGRLVFAASQDPSVYGGSMGRSHALKTVKAIEMAVSAGAPFLFLISSGGARIEEGVLALEGLGSVISALINAKGIIPLLGCVLGPCPGGLAIAAAKMDFLFFADDEAGLFINSPSVTCAAAGKSDAVKSVGTASVHAKKTGLASFVLPDETSCFAKVRELLSYIPVQTGSEMCFNRSGSADDPNRCASLLNDMAEETDEKHLDIPAVLRAVADHSAILEVSESYGADTVTAFASVDGINVGFVANRETRITEAGARKAASFVRFCTDFMLPIITFTDSDGFAIGMDIEESGIVSAACDLVSAFAESDVPRIGILVGDAIGTGYLSMNSKMLGADVVYSWPTAKIAILKADTAANILFGKQISASEDPASLRSEKVEAYEREIADPSVAAGFGQIDEIILPSATRPRIISALDMLLTAYPLSEK